MPENARPAFFLRPESWRACWNLALLFRKRIPHETFIALEKENRQESASHESRLLASLARARFVASHRRRRHLGYHGVPRLEHRSERTRRQVGSDGRP